MNRPITYKHFLIFILCLCTIFVLILSTQRIEKWQKDLIHEGFIDGKNDGYDSGFKAGIEQEKTDAKWRKTCSLAEQKKSLESMNKQGDSWWFVTEWCPNP